MLYFLHSINNDKTYYLVDKNEFIVGRKNCDILIENDSSISRGHAKICIKDDQKATIEDLKSKYKTYVNENEMTPNVEIQLNNGDKVQFGGLSSIFEFHQEHFITTATQLSVNQKEALKKQLDVLHGKYTDNWNSECTHLTLERISLTVKVLHALLEDKPIVVPAFWAKFAENVSKNISPPNITDYNDPPLAEALLNKVEFKNAAPRKDLFRGKQFLFHLVKEEKQVKDLIEKAGGTCSSWEKSPLEVEDLTEEHIVMQSCKDSDNKKYKSILKHISKQKKRTIPIQEIAMAIIHGSCEKDCNPNFNRAIEVFNAPSQKDSTQHNLLVHNTETQDFQNGTSTVQKIIPETVDPYQMDVPPMIKKLKIEHTIDLTESNVAEKERKVQKRVCEDVDNGENVAKKVKLEKTEIVARSLQPEHIKATKTRIEKQKENVFMKFQSQKRKTIEDSDSEESSAKEKTKNPFMDMIFAKRNRTESTENKNPLLNYIEEEMEKPLYSSTQISENRIMTRAEPVEYSRISKNGSFNLDSSWHSKKNCDNVKMKETEEISSELQQFINMFEKKVQVEVLSDASFRSMNPVDEVDCNAVSKGSNFKKFKKVKPIYPQTKVIGRDSFKLLSCTNSTGINDSRRKVAYDSDDEMPSTSNAQQKRKLKSFDI